VKATYPFYVIRLVGGLLYLSGMVIMLYNVLKTIAPARSSRSRSRPRPLTPEARETHTMAMTTLSVTRRSRRTSA
jgi:cbb3-type cytochrome oxidase subunit 1